MRMKRPAVVVHISPFVGDVGAVPCGIRSGARLVVAAGAITVPLNNPELAVNVNAIVPPVTIWNESAEFSWKYVFDPEST